MVIQLPRDIEERLNELADREGKPAEQLAADAIEAMLARSELDRRWPLPKTVAVSHDDEGDASNGDVWGDEDPPWAGLIGMFPGGGVKAEEFDEWLDAARASDERLARKTSIKR